ncbi:integumentary mucin A.1 isoform X1 [Esox lucius]|uniref:Uncharacterized protein n=1 Tax=Esox lucius TaxID=8010 RepID=A0A3P8ZZ75_ESOLU|nr:integumentary mucin A.1 isoform X1 [Esox lucius]
METKIYVSVFALVSMSLCLNVKGLDMKQTLPSQASPKPIRGDVPNNSSSIRDIIGTEAVMDPTISQTPPSHTETPAPLTSSVRVSTQYVPEKNSTQGNDTEKTPENVSVHHMNPSNTTAGPTTPHTPVSPSTLPSHVSSPSTHQPKLNTTKTNTTSPDKSSPLRPETIPTTSSTTQPHSNESSNLENSTLTQPTQTPSPKSTTTTSITPSAVPQSVPQPRTSSSTQSPLATTLTSSPPPQAKTHTNTPSQLNVVDAGQPVFHSGTPALDPLLAGLVSAFIVTAALITLLLFIKMRRQNQRPEFRRLQDLPMDDMMEDTPLSMYSY